MYREKIYFFQEISNEVQNEMIFKIHRNSFSCAVLKQCRNLDINSPHKLKFTSTFRTGHSVNQLYKAYKPAERHIPLTISYVDDLQKTILDPKMLIRRCYLFYNSKLFNYAWLKHIWQIYALPCIADLGQKGIRNKLLCGFHTLQHYWRRGKWLPSRELLIQ